MKGLKQFETQSKEVLKAAPQCVAPEAFMTHTQHLPAESVGGVFLSDELTALNCLISQCITILSIPCMDIVAPMLWGWGWKDVRRWSVRKKQLLLSFWRKIDGCRDDNEEKTPCLEDEAVGEQFYEASATSKPPPSNLRLSPCWLTSSCPLGLRAPDTSFAH